MSVLKSKRKPSQFEVFHHLNKVRKEVNFANVNNNGNANNNNASNSNGVRPDFDTPIK